MKRRTLLGGVAAAGAVVAAGLYRFTDLFVKHYPPTPYDDVLAQVVDREHAAVLGRHVAGPFDVPREAAALRTRLAGSTLESTAQGDVATGRLMEVDGWLVPQVVARLAALAARV
jgi:hypothetical protein